MTVHLPVPLATEAASCGRESMVFISVTASVSVVAACFCVWGSVSVAVLTVLFDTEIVAPLDDDFSTSFFLAQHQG